ncbi:MAG: sulfatase-like hydrolase/transferase [Actinobacteria bacterium]|nr:sulfatase-like hydrolase/transferase [Actinomycetota bacterium]
MTERPNLLLIITDQERPPLHWPAGYAEEQMPSRARLLRHGINFEGATCNTAMCSPSRASFLTGLMPAQTGVIDTLTEDGPFSATERILDPGLPNLGTMLRDGGYDVQWRGKWHLSKGPAGDGRLTAEELASYGFEGWVPPDAGGDTKIGNLGGGRADHDARYIEQATEYLAGRAASDEELPFCLVLSLVNPHDVLSFPREWTEDYQPQDLEGPVGLPASVDEDLGANLKPTAQRAMQPAIDMAVGALETAEQRRQYVNFYANLTARIDRQIAPIVDFFYAADGTPTPLGEETVIVRFSDHGELAMSHGGLRQKAFNVYEETMRVPLIFSNPRLFPEPASCSHPASLVDLVPTIAGLTGVTPPPGLRGTDLSPLLRDPGSGPVQDEVLFTFDDMHAGTGRVREIVPAAGRIRCIREPRFKYARYFHAEGSFPAEYEMYDLVEDPDELENLAHPDHPRYGDPEVVAERERLRARLAEVEARLARPVPG